MNAAARRRGEGPAQPAPAPVAEPGPPGASGVGGVARSVVSMAKAVVGSPRGVAGLALEVGWIAAHLGLYPLGLLGDHATNERSGYRISNLSPSRRGLAIRDVELAETPILLIHGLIDNRSIFTVLRRWLVHRGFGRIETMNYSVFTGDVRTAAARLAEEVERIVEETGYERIHIVGHSMGGLIARYYVTRLGGDEHVHTVVTLGTPHHGTYLAMGLNTNLTRQLRPGSALYAELDKPIPRCRTRFLVFWSGMDQVVLPQRNAMLYHADLDVTNIEVDAVGHMSLPVAPTVVERIAGALAHVGQDGATVSAGVSPIRSRR